MAGEIQIGGTTFATESGGTVTVSNVDSATNRTNLGLGSMATQNANAVALTGGSLTGTEIDLKSSGTTIYKSDGTNAVLSESAGVVTLTASNIHNSDGLKILEVVSWYPGNDVNKTVNTTYDYSTSLAAGTWLSFIDCYVNIFENHANSNSVGVYLTYVYLGSTSGGREYGEIDVTLPKWGNGTNGYDNRTSKVNEPFTLASTSTVYLRWNTLEYGTLSNYYVRNTNVGVNFLRIA